MTRAWLSAIALSVSVAWSPAAPRRQEAERPRGDRGVLAIVRQDGLLVPFAAVDGDRWLAPWPGGLRGLDVPVTLDAIPKAWWGGRVPGGWREFSTDGTSSPIALEAPVVYQVACERRLAVKTDRPRTVLPAAAEGPFPKTGLAASDGLVLDRIESVERSGRSYPDLAVDLLPAFNRAEENVLKSLGDFARWKHSIPADARRKVPVRIEAWYRSPMRAPGSSVSYIEAVRAYAPRPDDDGCGLETFFTGWVQHDRGPETPARTDIHARVMYCDRATALYMLPLGRLQTQKRMYWIFQLSGWDQEWYEVVEIAPGRPRFVVEHYGGGTCR